MLRGGKCDTNTVNPLIAEELPLFAFYAFPYQGKIMGGGESDWLGRARFRPPTLSNIGTFKSGEPTELHANALFELDRERLGF